MKEVGVYGGPASSKGNFTWCWFETEDSSDDDLIENLIQPLSHSAILELHSEAPVVCSADSGLTQIKS